MIGSSEAKERGMTKNEKEMMERRNAPSHKVAMQVIIGDVLESKNQMSTNEFISKLEARGVQVLFNQASTGYVSGISYSYQGMIMQGSKLGNGFKWSTVKNIIDYEQERDRQRIHETNVRSEYALNKLRASSQNAQPGRTGIRESPLGYEQIPVRTPAYAMCLFRPSFTARIITAAIHEAKLELDRATDSLIDAAFKIPKIIPLKTLLDAYPDSYRDGNNLSVANEPDMVARELKEEQRRKKRRGLRR